MFRTFGLAVLLGALSTSAWAVDISVVGGATMATGQVTTGSAYPTGIAFTTQPALAFGAGALLAVPLMPSVLDVEVGVLFLPRKNTLIANGPALAAEISQEETMPTVQLPVMLRINLLKIISLGGGLFYWWGNGTVTQTTGGVSTAHTWSDAGYTPHDYGFTASVALMMPVLPRLSLRVDARYLYGMTNLSTTSGITYETRDIQVLAGLQLTL